MPSFDVVSKVENQELSNAIQSALKEIATRYDFKGTKSTIKLLNDEIKVTADDDHKLKAITDILLGRLNKRGISPKSIDMGKTEVASGSMVRQNWKIIQGLTPEVCKEINKFIKESKVKVNGETHKDQLRVSGKNRDDLQTMMSLLKGKDFGPPLQFTNFRS